MFVDNTGNSNAVPSETGIRADESQTRMRKFKKRFIENIKKSPQLQHVDPEALWNVLDKIKIFRELKLPYQKVKERDRI